MRRSGLLLLALFVVAVFAASPREAHADATVGVNLFYDNLSPYGDWFDMENYGWVWTPRNVSSDWRPYTRGQWVFSQDDGWLFASDEEWGWATYHYGRWFFDDRYGWVWVPGNDWAPAWVAWRFGGGYVGWAPLPPQFRWNSGVGFRANSFDFDSSIAPRQYVFVPENHFVDSRVYRQVVAPARNWTIVDVTRNVTNYGVRQNRLVNRSLSVEDVEGHVGHAVPRVRVVDEPRTPPRRAEVKAGTVKVFRPPVRIDPTARPRSVHPSTEVARVKPHPVEPPADPQSARRPQRPPTVSPTVTQGQKPAAAHANVKPTPTDARRQPVENRPAAERREAELAQQRQSQAQKLERDRQREEQQARERRDQLQATQERQQQALKARQTQQEQQLRQKQLDQQQHEARARQGQQQAQLQRQQEEQRLKLQQQHERDHKALQDKQARQQQQLQEKQKKEQAHAEEARRKQQQREESKKTGAKAQSAKPQSSPAKS